jgi:AraC family transcriptional regulator
MCENMDIYSFEDVINQIESNLDGNIDIGDLAKKSGLSVYEFRRIFSFVAKIPVGEYIRKRRMSQAALRLINGEISVEDDAAIYGYDSVSSF